MNLSVVVLPSERWSENRRKWEHAEELGFHAAYTYDHLSWRSFRDRTWMSMVPLLGAVSTVTSTILLGPLVTSPNFRHPLLLAKDLITLDDLSDGRVVIGIGGGGQGFDATVFGNAPWTASERHERFKEFTSTLDQLLREPESTIEGTYYPILESRQIPGPRQLPRPPLLVSAMGPKGIAFAASVGDGWISVGGLPSWSGSTQAAVRTHSARLDDELASNGRTTDFERRFLDGQSDEAPMTSYEGFIDWVGRYRALGISELIIHYPVADSIFDYDIDLFERIATEGRHVVETEM